MALLDYVQDTRLDTSETSTSAIGLTVTAGNTMHLVLRVGATGRIVTVTDDKANVWVQDANKVQVTDAHELFILRASNIVAGVTTLTVAISGAATTLRMVLYEHVGDLIVDKIASDTGTGTTVDSGNTTLTLATKELLIGAGSGDSSVGSWTAGSGYGHIQNDGTAQRAWGEDQIVSLPGIYKATFTAPSSVIWACIVATYMPRSAVQDIGYQMGFLR